MEPVKFTARINAIGSSHYFAIPRAIMEYLELDIGTQIEISGFSGKNGKFMAVWKKGADNDD